jgi:hypothetical protein
VAKPIFAAAFAVHGAGNNSIVSHRSHGPFINRAGSSETLSHTHTEHLIPNGGVKFTTHKTSTMTISLQRESYIGGSVNFSDKSCNPQQSTATPGTDINASSFAKNQCNDHNQHYEPLDANTNTVNPSRSTQSETKAPETYKDGVDSNEAAWRPVLQRLSGTWLLLIVAFGILGPVYTPHFFASYFLVLHLVFLSANVRSCWSALCAIKKVKESTSTDWMEKYRQTVAASETNLDHIASRGITAEMSTVAQHHMPFESVKHLIIIPNYKETLDTLCETLDVLASHSLSLKQYKVKIHDEVFSHVK